MVTPKTSVKAPKLLLNNLRQKVGGDTWSSDSGFTEFSCESLVHHVQKAGKQLDPNILRVKVSNDKSSIA